MIDPDQEQRRLEAFYAGQMDGELEQVAGQAYELTDPARQALRAELAKRGLTPAFIEQVPAPPEPEPQPGDPPPPEPPVEEEFPSEDGVLEVRDMVTIRQFRDLPEALLAKGSLDSAGIHSALLDENIVRLDWFWSNLMGGIKLRVDAEDAADAEEVLSQPIPENFDVTGIGEYQQPHCPKCNSLDVNFHELDPAAYLTLAINVPIPIHRRAWRCRSCKAEWEDDGDPDIAKSPA
ncbi:MAG: hypothetical protein ACRD3B_10495 [Candidatus Sulfotelmatobacter sp.]